MYRKLSADQIFNGYEILPKDAVLVVNADGVVGDIVEKRDAGDDIEHFEGILSPGFINCHCHLELSHMKGRIPKHTGLIDFISGILNERHSTEEEILSAIENAEKEMLQNGIVAVGDICNTDFTINQKKNKNLHYHNFIEVSGFPPSVAQQRYERILDLYFRFNNQLFFNSIVPHAPYSVSSALFEKIVAFAENEIITMHNQETAAENELYKNGSGAFLEMYARMNIPSEEFQSSGKTSLQQCLPYFNINKPLILVHNVFTAESDIEYAKTNFNNSNDFLYYCLCPNANLYISNQLPDVNMFRKHQVNLVLGTDSLASNDRLNIFDEISSLQKHFPALSIVEMLKWATSNGARALQINNTYGSFEKGKKPGVVLIKNEKAKLILS